LSRRTADEICARIAVAYRKTDFMITSRLLIPLTIIDLPLSRPLGFSIYSQTGVLLTPRGYELTSLAARERILTAGPFRDANEGLAANQLTVPQLTSDNVAGVHPSASPVANRGATPSAGKSGDALPDVTHTVEYVQLIFQAPGELEKRTVAVEFHGKLGVQALIVSAPPLGRQRSWPSLVGMPLTVRLTSSRKVYQFDTVVLGAHTSPVPHVYLRYPEAVRHGVFRRSVRLEAKLPAVARLTDGREVAGTIADMSGAGCAFDADEALAEIGATFTLAFQTHLAHQGSMLVVPVVLRNLPKQPSAGTIRHGLSFGDGKEKLDAWLSMTLKAFICESLLEGEHAALG
jgi:hypothetical protein